VRTRGVRYPIVISVDAGPCSTERSGGLMRTGSKRWPIVAAALVALAATGCTMGNGNAASCATKRITLGDSDLRPGGEVVFSVDWMTATCEDTGGWNRAAEDVAVTITPSSTGDTLLLGTVAVASGPRFIVKGRFDLPEDLPAGRATLSVRSETGDEASATLPVSVSAVSSIG
jgi:hypothetical protein